MWNLSEAWDFLEPGFWDAAISPDYFASVELESTTQSWVLARVGRVVGADQAPAGAEWPAIIVQAGDREITLSEPESVAYLLAVGDDYSAAAGWPTPAQLSASVTSESGLRAGAEVMSGLVRRGLFVPLSGEPEPVRQASRQLRVVASSSGFGQASDAEYRSQVLRYAPASEGQMLLDILAQVVYAGAAYGSLLEAVRASMAVAMSTGQLPEQVTLRQIVGGMLSAAFAGTRRGLWRLEPALAEAGDAS